MKKEIYSVRNTDEEYLFHALMTDRRSGMIEISKEQIARRGKRLVPSLISALKHSSQDVLRSTAECLGTLSGTKERWSRSSNSWL